MVSLRSVYHPAAIYQENRLHCVFEAIVSEILSVFSVVQWFAVAWWLLSETVSVVLRPGGVLNVS